MEIDRTIVVTLRAELQRRQHIVSHFHVAGIEHFGFWPAVTPDDPRVRQMYQSGRVAGYPDCFRCGRSACTCDNNVLIPQQVANWLSFVTLWQSLPDDPGRYYLICEDDVAFHHGAIERLQAFLSAFEPSSHNVLIRLAQSGDVPYVDLSHALDRSERVVMSNAAYIINGSMAAYLTAAFDTISTTSDIWLHRLVARSPQVEALTVDPLIATELSFNKEHAVFTSGIHPKGIDEADVLRRQAHHMRVESREEYEQLLHDWGVSND